MILTDEEYAALGALEPAALLLGQLFEFRPGDYSFATSFPDEHAIWMRAAATFVESDKRDLRRFGRLMRKFMDAMLELDATEEDSWKYPIKKTKLMITLDRMTAASRWLDKKVVKRVV